MDIMDLRAHLQKSGAADPNGPWPRGFLLKELIRLQEHTTVHSSIAGMAQHGEMSKEAVNSCEENPQPYCYKYLDERIGKFIKGGQSARSTEGYLCPHSSSYFQVLQKIKRRR
jgi:hypothetical protein